VIFGKLKLYALVAILAVAGVWGWGQYNYHAGRSDMKRDIALAAAEARLANIEEVERVKDEVDALTDDEFLDALSEWVSENPGGN